MADYLAFLKEPADPVTFWRTIVTIGVIGFFSPMSIPFFLAAVCVLRLVPWAVEYTKTEIEEFSVLLAGFAVSLIFAVIGFYKVFVGVMV
jgi:hypothetical protein